MLNFGMAQGLAQMVEDMMAMIQNLSEEVISARVRTRALLEIMEEKGLLAPGEFDERASAVWERDYDELSRELMSLPQQGPDFPGDPMGFLDLNEEEESD